MIEPPYYLRLKLLDIWMLRSLESAMDHLMRIDWLSFCTMNTVLNIVWRKSFKKEEENQYIVLYEIHHF